MKFLSPTDVSKFLNTGQLTNVEYNTSEGNHGIRKDETSVYTRYLTIGVDNSSGKKMYDRALLLYNNPISYSGIINNCSQVAVDVISSGSSKIMLQTYYQNNIMPNTFFSNMIVFYDIDNI